MKNLKSYLLKPFALANYFPTRLVDQGRLQDFLNTLHPMSTDRELIRLGPKDDGGYLVPNDLAGIEACFSPGVCDVSGFEKDCAELGMKVFLADKSVERPAVEHPRFHFTKKFIGVTSNAEFMTLDNWVRAASLSEPNSDLLLQIDIEGYEYEVFLSTSDELMQRFRIIVAEFHRLDQFWSRPFFDLASRAFDKIRQTHTCVHIHPNNRCGALQRSGLVLPSVMEFTFLRHDRTEQSSYQRAFPHPLDCDNTTRRPIVLPKCWYRAE